MEKTNYQKTLKVMCIVWIVFLAITIVISLLAIVGGTALMGATTSASTTEGAFATSLGIGLLLMSLVDLVFAIFGLRGANDPKKIGVFFIMCIISLVISVISLIASVTQGGNVLSSIIGLIWPAVCLWLSYTIKQQGNNQPTA